MIPRLIHQTYKTREIPPRWKDYQAKVKSLHPDWGYTLWTDEDNAALIAREAPEYQSLYTSLAFGIMRADMIRYVILFLFGGLYLDCDYELLRAFDLVDKRIVLPRESGDDQELYLGNSIMASVPGHQFWKEVIRGLGEGVTALGRRPVEEEIAGLTGPGLVTRTYASKYRGDESVHVPRYAEFNPGYPADEAEYRALLSNGETYGIHHCNGSWRAKSVPQRVVRKLLSLWSRRAGR